VHVTSTALPSLQRLIWSGIKRNRTLAIVSGLGLAVGIFAVATMGGVSYWDGSPVPLGDLAFQLRLACFGTANALWFLSGSATVKWMAEQHRRDRSGRLAVALRGTFLGVTGELPHGPSTARAAPIEPDVSVIAVPIAIGIAAALFGFAVAMDLLVAYAGHDLGGMWSRRVDAAFSLAFIGVIFLTLLTHAASISRGVYGWATDRAAAAATAVADAERARLSVLRAQMTPQFLFGALERIELCAVTDAPRSEQIVEQLSVMLRHSLQRSTQPFTTVEDEVRFACEFLDVERSRSDSRMTVTTEIDPATSDLLVPTMCLQPIVENAIVHAMRARPATGHIRISASLAGGGSLLRLCVEDNGPGFPAATHEHRGLSDLRTRLRSIYERGQALDAEALSTGARVTISIPTADNAFANSVAQEGHAS
jgi:signal transduction histidine kinase